jgi:hypothetical protein
MRKPAWCPRRVAGGVADARVSIDAGKAKSASVRIVVGDGAG